MTALDCIGFAALILGALCLAAAPFVLIALENMREARIEVLRKIENRVRAEAGLPPTEIGAARDMRRLSDKEFVRLMQFRYGVAPRVVRQ